MIYKQGKADEPALTPEEWQDLRENLFVLLDITWDFSVNVATLEQFSVKKERGEDDADYNRRAHEAYNRRFKEVKENSFLRVIRVLDYLKKLGLPKELWPKETEIKGITGEKTS